MARDEKTGRHYEYLDVDRAIWDVRYLGDGVYAGHDDYQVWLYTDRNDGRHYNALKPEVLAALVDYNRGYGGMTLVDRMHELDRYERRFLAQHFCWLCDARLDRGYCGMPCKCDSETMIRRINSCLQTYKPRPERRKRRWMLV